MNNPSPLVPQGSMLEQKNRNRTRVRLAVFVVLSIHVIGLMALLMQGCRKPNEAEMAPEETAPPPPSLSEASNQAPYETSIPPAVMTPPPMETVPPPPLPNTQEYVIVKGDTLSTIAKKFGVTIKAIEEANPGIQPTKLQIGQKLMIPPPQPGAATTSPSAAGTVTMGSGGEQTYIVKSGDNLTKIAAQFGTTVKALRAENNLTTDRIKVGQKLKIPAGNSTAPTQPPPPTPVPPATTPEM